MKTLITAEFNPFDQAAQMSWRAQKAYFSDWKGVEIINSSDGDGWGNGGEIRFNESAAKKFESLKTSSAHKKLIDVLSSNKDYTLLKWEKPNGTKVQSVERPSEIDRDGYANKKVEVFRVEYPYATFDLTFGMYGFSVRKIGEPQYGGLVNEWL